MDHALRARRSRRRCRRCRRDRPARWRRRSTGSAWRRAAISAGPSTGAPGPVGQLETGAERDERGVEVGEDRGRPRTRSAGRRRAPGSRRARSPRRTAAGSRWSCRGAAAGGRPARGPRRAGRRRCGGPRPRGRRRSSVRRRRRGRRGLRARPCRGVRAAAAKVCAAMLKRAGAGRRRAVVPERGFGHRGRSAERAGGEVVGEQAGVDPLQRLDVGDRDALVDLVHRRAVQAELDDRAVVLDEARVRGAAGGRERRRRRRSRPRPRAATSSVKAPGSVTKLSPEIASARSMLDAEVRGGARRPPPSIHSAERARRNGRR